MLRQFIRTDKNLDKMGANLELIGKYLSEPEVAEVIAMNSHDMTAIISDSCGAIGKIMQTKAFKDFITNPEVLAIALPTIVRSLDKMDKIEQRLNDIPDIE